MRQKFLSEHTHDDDEVRFFVEGAGAFYLRNDDTVLKGRGRHDPCVLPRAVPIVEAMAALVLVDHALRHAALAP